jgi:glycosyltransferase involved in cell wall biosynthesis
MIERLPKLGILTSHAIQYHVPVYREITNQQLIELDVFFMTDAGLNPTYDPGFRQVIKFDVDLISGYSSRILKNRSPFSRGSGPFRILNTELLSPRFYREVDALLINGWGNASLIVAILGCQLTRTPYFVLGDSILQTKCSRKVHRFKLLIKRAVVGTIVRRASMCLAIGTENSEFYVAYGAKGSQICFVPLTVDNEAFRRAGEAARSQRAEYLQSLQLNPALPTVLFTGKLQTWKRPQDVIEAAKLMKVEANIVLIGDGPMMTELRELSEGMDNVRLLGFVNQAAIGGWYGVADLFVLPSKIDHWGLAVNEAMAAGSVPVVSDAVGCGRDLVQPDTGFKFSVGDFKQLADVLDVALSDATHLDTLRANGSALIDRYSPQVAATNIAMVVRDLGRKCVSES